MKDLQRELRRGTLDLVLLHLLAEEPTYGYELVSRLRSRSGDGFRVKEGTLYPVLYRLEDAGFIEPEWTRPEIEPGTQSAGRGVPRKIYRVTQAGTQRLAELATAWREFENSVNAVLAPSPDEAATEETT